MVKQAETRISSAIDTTEKHHQLRLIRRKKALIRSATECECENAPISVVTSRIHPNGATEYATEEAIREPANEYLYQYGQGLLPIRTLYNRLRELWGTEVFEDTRHCFENMKQRAGAGYAPLDPRFESFPNFLRHMGPRPDKEASIHRKDNSQGYSPENCVWADKRTQSRQRTNTIYLTCNDETLALTEWAERLDVSPDLLRRRKAKGWNDYDVIHGKLATTSCAIPATAPWPPGARERFEAKFRMAGGRTHVDRLVFLLRWARDTKQALDARFNYDWDEHYVPSPEEVAGVHEWNARYDRAKFYENAAIRGLKQLYRYDLISCPTFEHQCEHQ